MRQGESRTEKGTSKSSKTKKEEGNDNASKNLARALIQERIM